MQTSAGLKQCQRQQHSRPTAAASRQACKLKSISVQATTAPVMQRIDSIEQCLEQFTGILLDQFGVLHDGKVPYPHAAAAVQRLAEAGKQIIILSNSSRRSGGTIGKLAKMGFKEEWFAGVLHLKTKPHNQPWESAQSRVRLGNQT